MSQTRFSKTPFELTVHTNTIKQSTTTERTNSRNEREVDFQQRVGTIDEISTLIRNAFSFKTFNPLWKKPGDETYKQEDAPSEEIADLPKLLEVNKYLFPGSKLSLSFSNEGITVEVKGLVTEIAQPDGKPSIFERPTLYSHQFLAKTDICALITSLLHASISDYLYVFYVYLLRNVQSLNFDDLANIPTESLHTILFNCLTLNRDLEISVIDEAYLFAGRNAKFESLLNALSNPCRLKPSIKAQYIQAFPKFETRVTRDNRTRTDLQLVSPLGIVKSIPVSVSYNTRAPIQRRNVIPVDELANLSLRSESPEPSN